ncbi:MAG: EamA family transporter [Acidaminococcaceae bacterium]|nr:EamA family transporter [Acidaminococcaceae bacterium]
MRNPNQNQHLRGILMAVSGCIFWGASGIAGQYLLTDRAIPTYWLTGARLILSGLFLLGLDRILSGRNPCRIWREKRDRLPLVLFGTLGMLGTQYFYFATIKESNAAIATILQYLMAILIVLWVCLRERRLPRLREFWCTLAAVLGTVLIVTGGRWDSLAVSPKALVLGLLSAAAAALYTVQPRDMILRWGAPLTVGWGMIVGGLVCLPFAQPWNYDMPRDLPFLGAFAFVVLLGTVLAFSLYIASVQYIPPQVTGILGATEPVSSIFFSMLFFGLAFGPIETAGIVLILGAVFALGRA